LWTCDSLAKTADDSKKRRFTVICYREYLIIFHIVWTY
jgi:hypothetical protein